MPIRNAARPLYHRVYKQIAHEIEQGALDPGDRLPSERWFCDELGVSRATVRRAIEELVAEGLVEPRGRGTVVSGAPFVEPPNTLVSLSELGRARGLAATARVLCHEVRPATIDEADAFAIAPGAELLELRRLRMLDGLPMSLDHNRVPLRFLPALDGLDFPTASLYAAIEGAGHPPAAPTTSWRPAARTRRRPSCWGWRPARRCSSRRPSRSARTGGSWISGRTVYRADRYRFQATLTRRTQRERGSNHEEALGWRPVPVALAIVVAGCGGTPGEDKRREPTPGHAG